MNHKNRMIWQPMLAMAVTLLLFGVPISAQEGGAANPEIEEQAMVILKKTADLLSQAKHFSFTADVGFDVRQDWGQKIEFGETRTVTVRRPDRVRVDTTRRDGSTGSFIFDGKDLVFFNSQENAYATVAKPGSLDDAIAYFLNDLGMQLPLAELVSSRLPQIVSERARAARYVEQSTIASVPCDHLALRSDRTDLQVWIARGEQPLPQRLLITYTQAEGQPQFWAQFREWNLSATPADTLFAFTPPAGAARIAFLPRLRGQTNATETKGGQQ